MLHFGEHLTIDGYGASYDLLNDEQTCLSVILDLPALLDMHTLSQPIIVAAPDNQLKDPGGWSGFVIIAESHIAFHTFPKRGFLTADIYTCQNGLDTQKIIAYLTDKFALQQIETNFIKRGLLYPAQNIY